MNKIDRAREPTQALREAERVSLEQNRQPRLREDSRRRREAGPARGRARRNTEHLRNKSGKNRRDSRVRSGRSRRGVGCSFAASRRPRKRSAAALRADGIPGIWRRSDRVRGRHPANRRPARPGNDQGRRPAGADPRHCQGWESSARRRARLEMAASPAPRTTLRPAARQASRFGSATSTGSFCPRLEHCK